VGEVGERTEGIGPLGPGVRLALGVTAAVAFLGTYMVVAHATSGRSYDLTTFIDEAVPVVPWTFVLYVPAYAAGILATLFTLRESWLLRGTVAVFVGEVMSFVVYVVLPSTYPRIRWFDGYDYAGWSGASMAWLHSFDPPNNTCPSAHVMVAFLCALYAFRDGTRWRWFIAFTALGVFVSVLTLKQHYWVDGVAGVAVGLIAVRLVDRWLPERSRRGETSRFGES